MRQHRNSWPLSHLLEALSARRMMLLAAARKGRAKTKAMEARENILRVSRISQRNWEGWFGLVE